MCAIFLLNRSVSTLFILLSPIFSSCCFHPFGFRADRVLFLFASLPISLSVPCLSAPQIPVLSRSPSLWNRSTHAAQLHLHYTLHHLQAGPGEEQLPPPGPTLPPHLAPSTPPSNGCVRATEGHPPHPERPLSAPQPPNPGLNPHAHLARLLPLSRLEVQLHAGPAESQQAEVG